MAKSLVSLFVVCRIYQCALLSIITRSRRASFHGKQETRELIAVGRSDVTAGSKQAKTVADASSNATPVILLPLRGMSQYLCAPSLPCNR
ncbi:hypothetical protein B0T16DRAFT_411851 [Cercophora newfieldiana]|uniref:Secreted protein n=1 Tax=Cercophora newfieldiana TaxID=92897 RepID=A0AA39Y6G0_9PEZI|nr:hypothetical protein B0T16DRAFT_411851 [Cercophora newfieldiana]